LQCGLQPLHVNTLEATEESAPAAGPCHSGARSISPEDSRYSASFIVTFALLLHSACYSSRRILAAHCFRQHSRSLKHYRLVTEQELLQLKSAHAQPALTLALAQETEPLRNCCERSDQHNTRNACIATDLASQRIGINRSATISLPLYSDRRQSDCLSCRAAPDTTCLIWQSSLEVQLDLTSERYADLPCNMFRRNGRVLLTCGQV